MKKPYILSPCGSYDALKAAICAGTDECYFGGNSLNARMNAKGFTDEEFFEALRLLRLYGVRSNITLNTLVFDRELSDVLDFAISAYNAGADAFIVQDTGLASLLRREIPNIELHASTQCACHNLDSAKRLSELGFSRIVLARELSYEDIAKITEYGKSTGTFETEVFVHGALCVCHSGMCLMSSVIGKRSGNRGLCAQPCRMMGSLEGENGKKLNIYPLSLRDLSLSTHIKELLPLGIASLKIEGRMKSPDYVYRVTKIFRELIDTETNADSKIYNELSDIFSRGGFTDGYFTKNYLADNRKMYGFRSEADKEKTANVQENIPELPKLPVNLCVSVKKGEKPTAKYSFGSFSGEFSLEKCADTAQNAPLTKETVFKNMSKLGSTPYFLKDSEIQLDDGLFLTAGDINSLRRGAIDNLYAKMTTPDREKVERQLEIPKKYEKRSTKPIKLRHFARDFSFTIDKNKFPHPIESVCYPLEAFTSSGKPKYSPFGVALPRVIFEDETENIRTALKTAKDMGASYVYISNIGHLSLSRETGLEIYGGMGLNITNSQSFSEYSKMGFSSLCLSCELKSAQVRDMELSEGVKSAIPAYGALPLMVLESCILRANGLCTGVTSKGTICGEYTDRIGKKFKICGERRFSGNGNSPCRNIIYNAEILDLYHKESELSNFAVDVLEIYEE